MRIENNQIGHAEAIQLLQHGRAIEGFARVTMILATFIEEGHDDIDSSCLAADGHDDAEEIPEMIIRTRPMLFSENRKLREMRKDIGDDENIVSANGLIQCDFAFSGLEAHDLRLDHIIASQISGAVDIGICALRFALLALLVKHVVDLSCELVVRCVGNDSDRSERLEEITAKIGIKPFGVIRTLI